LAQIRFLVSFAPNLQGSWEVMRRLCCVRSLELHDVFACETNGHLECCFCSSGSLEPVQDIRR
jgi:hypothetical protein